MPNMYRAVRVVSVLALLAVLTPSALVAQQAAKPFEPEVGQPGKDVVWVPTPPALVEKMMDMAQVRPDDFVVDLGSGDGRNIIAAAKRGANALGVEYNPDMVQLSERLAKAAGVSDKAKFVQGDMFTADFSKASVAAIFLLPSNMLQLRSKFFALAPGSRIVSNTFRFEGWNPDKSETIGGDCTAWCEAILWIVPAKVAGRWRGPEGELSLTQDYQMVSGTLTLSGKPVPVAGKLDGRNLTLKAGDREYTGRAGDNEIELTAAGGAPLKLTRAGS
jgi:SAM-dependent methyltransferase